MSTEIRPEPELPFRPKEKVCDLNKILTREARVFDFGSKARGDSTDMNEVEGTYDLTEDEKGPVIVEFKDGTYFYSSQSVGVNRLEKIRSDIPLGLAQKVLKGKGLTEEEADLVEEGKF